MNPSSSLSVSQLPLLCATLRLIFTALCTQFSHPRSGLGLTNQKSVHYRRPLPPVLHRLSYRPRPSPQVPVGPFSPAPQDRFCRLVPNMVVPLLLSSTFIMPLPTCGFSLLGNLLLLKFLSPPPCRPQPAGLVTSGPERGRASSPGLLSSSVVFPIHLILLRPVS